MNTRAAVCFAFASLSFGACAGHVSDEGAEGPQVITASTISGLAEGEKLDVDLSLPESSYVLDGSTGAIDTSKIRLVMPDGNERPATGWHGLPEWLEHDRWEIVAQSEPESALDGVAMQQQALKSTGTHFTCVPDVGCIGIGAWDCQILRRVCGDVFTIATGPGGGVACYCD